MPPCLEYAVRGLWGVDVDWDGDGGGVPVGRGLDLGRRLEGLEL